MTDEQLIALLSYYHDFICADCYPPLTSGKKLRPGAFNIPSFDVAALSGRCVPEHLAWMCSESIKFVQKGDVEKAHRWLGFIQGVLWKEGAFTLNDLREHVINVGKNRHPDYER
jgi:hypothetical protein